MITIRTQLRISKNYVLNLFRCCGNYSCNGLQFWFAFAIVADCWHWISSLHAHIVLVLSICKSWVALYVSIWKSRKINAFNIIVLHSTLLTNSDAVNGVNKLLFSELSQTWPNCYARNNMIVQTLRHKTAESCNFTLSMLAREFSSLSRLQCHGYSKNYNKIIIPRGYTIQPCQCGIDAGYVAS